MQYGASSILAYIVAARDKREAHAEDIWLSVQARASQHYNEQGITLDACIEEAIATLIEVNARVSDDLKSKRKAERGGPYCDSSSDDEHPSLEFVATDL